MRNAYRNIETGCWELPANPRLACQRPLVCRQRPQSEIRTDKSQHVVPHVAIVFSDRVLALPDKRDYGNTHTDSDNKDGGSSKQELVLFQIALSPYHCLFAGGWSTAIKSRSSKYLFTVLPFTWAKT